MGLRGQTHVVLRVDHLGAQIPYAVLHGVSVEKIRAHKIRIVGLDLLPVKLRQSVPQDVARQQHARGLAADAAGADLALFDLDKILGGKIFAAQLQPGGLDAQQALDDVFAQGHAVLVGDVLAPRHEVIEHLVPAVALLAGLGEFVENGVAVRAGGEALPCSGAADAQREIHVLRVAAGHLDRQYVDVAVVGAHVQQHRHRVAYAGDGVVSVALVHHGHVGDRALLGDERRGEADEVRHHIVGKPELLQLRYAVENEKYALALAVYYPVDLHGKGLEADVGIQLVLFHVGAGGGQAVGVHDLLVVAEADVNDALSGPGNAHDEAVGDIHIVRKTVYLPGHVVAHPQILDYPVKPLDTGAHLVAVKHTRTPRRKIYCKVYSC